jgi:outer membrane protein TolC
MVNRAETALMIQQVDYRRGIVTELEVQTTIQSVLDLNLEQADLRYQVGQLRAEALKSGAPLPERAL